MSKLDIVKNYFLQKSLAIPVVDPEWEGDIEEEAALAAHLHGEATEAEVSPTPDLGLGLSPQSDVASLPPPLPPGVPHQPEVSELLVSAVSHQLHCVVDGDVRLVVAALVNSFAVSGPTRGEDSDCQRSHLGQVAHHGGLVVTGESVVPRQSHYGWECLVVVLTLPALAGLPWEMFI